ncbi:hypothetical protein [Halarcobacter ebronensis]|uniref:Holin of 3TMs, for gene-transfer release n=1 Tax=Halarcobacter ebronensis TaxID=1462615 RepID=A0A4Q1AVJ1_9BACT|nr:hypothetical protein [Halarcobacter ebronensis]QKF82045.1 hypothetical protein AEBR_1562 [Halarcobacter ebronensis]RXK04121.1 hypothetical protein CRV07_11890 [Halarcobacter ebronensis]
MLFELIKLGVDAFSSWNSNRSEIKKIKLENKKELVQLDHELKVAKAQSQIRMAEQDQAQTYNLDMQTTIDMAKTYKDEFILIIFYIPMIMAFIGYQDEVLKAFKSLDLMPDWYILIIVLLAVSISGMRGLFKQALELIGSKFNLKGK